ncbi:MAG: N-acetylmuramoyl-L-alanine amidase [Chloroflexi bacterium]|nr:N-acetylmuramoyl-L-alanine amidase [Chloroflexota bacterium]
MRNQSTYSGNQPTSPPIFGFLRRNLPVVLFLAIAFSGMVLVYWYFSPADAEADAASVAASFTNEEGALTAPIHKVIPALPVIQRLAQSPGPIRVGVIAGHKGSDAGAVCPDGLTEAQVNENIVDLMLANLQAAGVRVEKLDEFDPRLTGYAATAVISVHADSCDYVNELATGFKIAGSISPILAHSPFVWKTPTNRPPKCSTTPTPSPPTWLITTLSANSPPAHRLSSLKSGL